MDTHIDEEQRKRELREERLIARRRKRWAREREEYLKEQQERLPERPAQLQRLADVCLALQQLVLNLGDAPANDLLLDDLAMVGEWAEEWEDHEDSSSLGADPQQHLDRLLRCRS